MSKDSYEFSYMSQTEKRKLVAAKVVLLVSIIYSLWSLISTSRVEASQAYFDAAWVLAAVFAYINVLRVRSEFAELIEHPLEYQGVEFMVLSGILFFVGIYFQFA